MSESYSIACNDCKVRLWIGQESGGGETLYTGQIETMESLRVFLFEHRYHSLIFDKNQKLEDDGFVEFNKGPVYQLHYKLGTRKVIVQKPTYLQPYPDAVQFWGQEAFDLDDISGAQITFVSEDDPAFVFQFESTGG